MDRVSTIANRLKEYREMYDLSLAQMSERTGLPAQTINRYELGQRVPKIDTAINIAISLDINPLWLQGYDVSIEVDNNVDDLPPGAFPINPTRRIPLIGQIAAGLPLYAEQNLEGYIWTDRNHGAEYFGLRVRGDSMDAANIKDGDIIIVRKQETVEKNDIAVILVDDNATIKRYQQQGEMVILTPQSTNPQNQTQIYSLKEHDIRILGKVVESRTEY